MSTTSLRLSEGGVDPHWAQFIDFEADESPPLTHRKRYTQTDRSNSDSEPATHGSDPLRNMHRRTMSHGPLDSSPKENNDFNVERNVVERRQTHKRKATLRSYKNKPNSNNLLPRTEALLMAIADSSITAPSGKPRLSPMKTKSVTFEEQPQCPAEKARRTKSLGTLIGKFRRR